MTNSSSVIRALGFIILGSLLVSFTSVFVELSNVGPSVSGFYRVFFGGIILMGISLVRKDRVWFNFKSLRIPFFCALFFSLDLFFWHRCIEYVGPGLATILGNMQVFIVALFAVWLLKERLSWQLLVAIPIAVTGLFLIVQTGWGEQGGQIKLGVLYGIITAITYGWYILTLRHSRSDETEQRFSIFANMGWISLLSAAMMGISVIIEPEASFAIPDLQTWGSLLGLGLVGQVFGWVLISKGLPDVTASLAGLAILLQPALAFIWDILFFGRPTTSLEYLGAVIVLGAIYLGSMGNRKGRYSKKY